ncbi:map/microtubule affinity-regulating kinase [Anaeramoeba flamelloides]|uniref:Map/microtubule affinity-regulating kinase n=1 Tax=Anaeramoeba flamelloides TaxID=1746091 RepID=A0AAV7Y8Q5_9EUKA|nr:map/microtubule affinity-regulating kinase [Anaeramoeba flamelloides]
MKKLSLPNYTLEKQIKQEKKGKIYLATHNLTKKKVKVKIIHKLQSFISNDLGNFISELNIVKQFDHPNFLHLIGVHEDAKRYYIISEFYKGLTLFEYIDLNGTFKSIESIRKIFSQLFSILQYTQKLSFYHGNINPSLIIVDKDLNLKMKLFGFANLIYYKKDEKFDFTQFHQNAYNEFVCPELQSKTPLLTSTSDVWSVATILYYCLTKKYLFQKPKMLQNENFQKKVHKLQLPKWIRKDLQTLFEKMLIIDHRKRIPIEEILNHQFFSNKKELISTRGNELRFKNNNIIIEAKILIKLDLFGLNLKSTIKGLLKNEYNSLTASYRILCNDNHNDNLKSISSLNDNDIKEINRLIEDTKKELERNEDENEGNNQTEKEKLTQKTKKKKKKNPIIERQQKFDNQIKKKNSSQFKTLTLLLNSENSSNTDENNKIKKNQIIPKIKIEKINKAKQFPNPRDKQSFKKQYKQMLIVLENKNNDFPEIKKPNNNNSNNLFPNSKIRKNNKKFKKEQINNSNTLDNKTKRDRLTQKKEKLKIIQKNYNDYLKIVLKDNDDQLENRYSPMQLKRMRRKSFNSSSNKSLTELPTRTFKKSTDFLISNDQNRGYNNHYYYNNNNNNLETHMGIYQNQLDPNGSSNENALTCHNYIEDKNLNVSPINFSKSYDYVNKVFGSYIQNTKSQNNHLIYQVNEMENLDIDEILNTTISSRPRIVLLKQYLDALKELGIFYKKIKKYKYFCKANFRSQILKFYMLIVKLPTPKMINRVKFIRIQCNIGTFYALLKEIEEHIIFF